MTDLYAAITNALAPRPAFPSLPEGYFAIERMIKTTSQFTDWRSIMEQYYPGAVRVQVEIESEYNDEGYSDVIRSVTAFDALGNRVPFYVEGVTDEAELQNTFYEVLWEWPIPEFGEIDLNKPPRLQYTSRAEMRERMQSMVDYIDQLPHGFFEDETAA